MESSSLEEQNLAPKLSRAGVYRAIANIADIGTSPFYAVNAIIVAIYLVGFGVGLFTTETMVNAMSFLFWTNTALITGKYAFLYLRYTWHGEGGVAALTSLVKSVFQSKVFQLMITTPITTGSAGASFFAEGTAGNRIFASICVVGIVWVISLGVKKASNIISPFMLAWFVFLFFSGIYGISKYPTILNFFNPVHAVMFVKNFLGLSVGITALLIVLNKEFLTKTGGEAFYAGVAQYGA